MEISAHETEWLKNKGATMLTDIGVKPGNTVLDFGCGKGRYTVPLSQIVGKEGRVYSVERNEETIQIARERLPVFSNADAVHFVNVDNIEVSDILQDKSVDAILAFDVLQYIQDWDALFVYFRKLIKPTGIVCIYPAAIPHPGDVDIELLLTKMKQAGFQFIEARLYRMMHNVDMVDDTVYLFSV